MNRIANNIKALMAERGVTSEAALAKEAGIEQATLNRIVGGKTKDPRDSTLLPLADYFGVSVDELKRGKSPTAGDGGAAGPKSSQSVIAQRAKIAAVVRLTDYIRDVALEPIPPEKHGAIIDAAIAAVDEIGVRAIMDGSGLIEGAKRVAAGIRSR